MFWEAVLQTDNAANIRPVAQLVILPAVSTGVKEDSTTLCITLHWGTKDSLNFMWRECNLYIRRWLLERLQGPHVQRLGWISYWNMEHVRTLQAVGSSALVFVHFLFCVQARFHMATWFFSVDYPAGEADFDSRQTRSRTTDRISPLRHTCMLPEINKDCINFKIVLHVGLCQNRDIKC